MADKQAKVEISVDGAERAAAAARASLQPWVEWSGKAQAGMRSLGSDAKQALGGVISDIGRVITVGSSLSFAGAVTQVQTLEKAASQLSTAMGRDFSTVKAQIDATGEAIGASSEQVANFVLNAGRLSHDFDGASKSIKAFRDFAKDTGRELTDMSGGVLVFKRMGADADKAFAQIRALGKDAAGGPAALYDQVSKLSPLFAKTSNDASHLIALTAQLGKGARTPEEAEARQQALSAIAGNMPVLEAHFRRTGELGKGEHFIDRKTGRSDLERAAKMTQTYLRSLGSERGFRIGSNVIGSPEAAAALLGINFGQTGALAGQGTGTNAAARWAATPGGMQEGDEARRAREMGGLVGHDSTLGGLRESFRGFAASHPLLGAAAEFGVSAVFGGAGKRLTGGEGSGGGEAAGGLGKAWLGWRAARAGWSALRAGGTMAGLGTLGTVALGSEAMLEHIGLLGRITAPLNQSMPQVRGETEALLTGSRSGAARALIRAAERSGGTEEGFIRHAGSPLLARAGYGPNGQVNPALAGVADPVLASLFEQLRGGSPKIENLPRDIAREVASALRGSPLQINVVTDTAVNVTQPGGDQ